MSFSQGITGLAASAAQLDAIGNNIANSGTIGYKSSTVAFKDVIAGSKIGLGVSVAAVQQNFAAGSVQLTSRPLDFAITNGNGFFRVESPEGGSVSYSRNGQFTVDANGYVVSPNGMRLTGYGVTANGSLAGGTPTALRFPTQSMTPKATAAVTAQFNLDSRRQDIDRVATPFVATDSSTYHYSNALNVFDSLGNPHEVVLFFTKSDTATSEWEVQAQLAGSTGTTTTPAAVAVTFDENGAIRNAAPAYTSFTIAGTYGNGAATPAFTVDLAGSTQFGNISAVQRLSQDGYTSGVLTSYEIGTDGVITGKYSNDQSNVLGQVVLSSFANPNGLEPIGNNMWSETGMSGQPLTGTPGEGTTLGSLTSGALEASNVDLTSELVNLITAQRGYQANAQTLKTQDQVMQTLVNLR
ncbi:flagellar hook protein FlgE [Ramlibacter sp. RBP-2]|uniref:Flagellar hook protein FlgE n=1 Tax=Ramlibacter lithotrophicus TaxID=2606681 RepID=A0A7X6DFF5_9BURK|nr:flagellar hook protein FlgE [Ramlibacter lithotrophicus]NKE66180.1 flagellar hook protein FlgE [Ramlibacter lithotrophicus]